jgi:hypothetical protein
MPDQGYCVRGEYLWAKQTVAKCVQCNLACDFNYISCYIEPFIHNAGIVFR